MSPSPEKPIAKTAILIFHGMGQQVPYETVGNLAHSVAEQWPESGAERKFTIESVPRRDGKPPSPDCGLMARVRLETGGAGSGAPEAVDFFESYWAPITEGKVGLIDSVSFLLSAGCKGVLLSRNGVFDRVFWKSARRFEMARFWQIAQLTAAAGLIAALFVFGLTLVFLLLAHLLQHFGQALLAGAPAQGGRDWNLIAGMFDRDLFRILQGEMLFFLRCLVFLSIVPGILLLARAAREGGGKAIFAGLGILFLAYHFLAALLLAAGWRMGGDMGRFFQSAGLSQAQAWTCLALILLQALGFIASVLRAREPWLSHAVNRFVWGNIFLLIGICLAMAGLILVSFWSHWGDRPAFGWEGFFSSAAMSVRHNPATGPILGWLSKLLLVMYGAGGLAALMCVRFFLIQYAGDVAAYINYHTVSKFSEIRSRIQEEAFKAARHVYASGYEKVILVAHSLGSVIAYDAYNRMVTESALFHPEWDPAGRTRLFLTFGSPLNKIAFIFRSQVKQNGVRELLASAKQPLLDESHAFRPHMWVNVWSRNDIISGPLDLYDCGEVLPKDVSQWPASGDFTYSETSPGGVFPDPGFSGEVKLGAESGPARPGCRPIIPLVDPEADLPIAAHTQYWKNKMIYRVIVEALRDGSVRTVRRQGSPVG